MRQINFQDVLDSPTTEFARLGELGQLPDGRVFKYVQHNEAFAQGQVGAAVANTAVTNITATSNNGLGQTVFIEESGAGWTVDQFADAYGLVSGNTGSGQFFKIKTNTADTLELYPDYRIRTALDTTSDLTLVRQHLCQLAPAALTGNLEGVYQGFTASVANDFCWMLVSGIGTVLSDATGGVAGEYCGPSNGTVGSVETMGAGETIDDVTTIGTFIAGNASELGLANVSLL